SIEDDVAAAQHDAVTARLPLAALTAEVGKAARDDQAGTNAVANDDALTAGQVGAGFGTHFQGRAARRQCPDPSLHHVGPQSAAGKANLIRGAPLDSAVLLPLEGAQP